MSITSTQTPPPDLATRFHNDGFAIIRSVLNEAEIAIFRSACEPLLHADASRRPGVRQLLKRAPALREHLNSPTFKALLGDLGAPDARPVRSILFDKSPTANWLVPWHQDATIALTVKADIEGFGPWSIKDGEHHCRPPRWLLDRLFAVRIHLDDNDATNGPLRVIPGSHANGLLPESSIESLTRSSPIVECMARAGDAVVLRPPLVHASSRSMSTARRRVVHVEFCDASLPIGVEWAEA